MYHVVAVHVARLAVVKALFTRHPQRIAPTEGSDAVRLIGLQRPLTTVGGVVGRQEARLHSTSRATDTKESIMTVQLTDTQVYRILGVVWERAIDESVEYGESAQAMWAAACDGGAPDATRYYECQSEVYDDLAARMRAAAEYVEHLCNVVLFPPTMFCIDCGSLHDADGPCAHHVAYHPEPVASPRCGCGERYESCLDCPF
jgi:hypothetical protein